MEIEFIKDVLLIALVGASAFYCWMLSHRLKRLNDLKSGVGASIVTLTEAIERTHSAAATARTELFDAIEEIKGLLEDAETKSDRLETAMDRADVKIVESEQAVAALTDVVEVEVPEARRKALKTTEGLLKVMADMKRLNAGLNRPQAVPAPTAETPQAVQPTDIQQARRARSATQSATRGVA
jgi:predicted  nucleic acid-binding Zn-ribbon protein